MSGSWLRPGFSSRRRGRSMSCSDPAGCPAGSRDSSVVVVRLDNASRPLETRRGDLVDKNVVSLGLRTCRSRRCQSRDRTVFDSGVHVFVGVDIVVANVVAHVCASPVRHRAISRCRGALADDERPDVGVFVIEGVRRASSSVRRSRRFRSPPCREGCRHPSGWYVSRSRDRRRRRRRLSASTTSTCCSPAA